MQPIWLVAHDFSPAAEAALGEAASVLVRLSGELLLLHAYRLPPVTGGLEAMANRTGLASWNRISARFEDSARTHLEDVAARASTRFPGLAIRTRMEEGAPAPTVARVAEEEKVDRVVVGYSPRGGLSRRIIVSNTDRILQLSPVPVLVVKASGAPGPL